MRSWQIINLNIRVPVMTSDYLESGMTSEPGELGTQTTSCLSFHLNQPERASSDLLSEKKMNRNTKPLMTLLRIKREIGSPSPQNAQWNVITS